MQPFQKKAHLFTDVLFSVIFALRRVLLLRSDIRLMPSDIRFASFGGEYNITATNGSNITFAEQKYHADEVGISLKLFTLCMLYAIIKPTNNFQKLFLHFRSFSV